MWGNLCKNFDLAVYCAKIWKMKCNEKSMLEVEGAIYHGVLELPTALNPILGCE